MSEKGRSSEHAIRGVSQSGEPAGLSQLWKDDDAGGGEGWLAGWMDGWMDG
jgi:hypothetical protein